MAFEIKLLSDVLSADAAAVIANQRRVNLNFLNLLRILNFDGTIYRLHPFTADAADISSLILSGGGAEGSSRGGSIYLFGNESASPGKIFLTAGDVAGGQIILELRDNQASALRIYENGTDYITIDTTNSNELVTVLKELLTASFLRLGGRLETKLGANVASANDVTLGNDGNVFKITGTTQINRIALANWQAGPIILHFLSTPTVKHQGAANTASLGRLNLSGSVDFVATANSRMMIYGDGAEWWEMHRTLP